MCKSDVSAKFSEAEPAAIGFLEDIGWIRGLRPDGSSRRAGYQSLLPEFRGDGLPEQFPAKAAIAIELGDVFRRAGGRQRPRVLAHAEAQQSANLHSIVILLGRSLSREGCLKGDSLRAPRVPGENGACR